MAFIYDLDNEGQGKIISDSNSDASALHVQSGVAGHGALQVGRTVAGSQTVASLRIDGPSVASGVVFEVRAGFVSCTSVILTTVANSDYCIPVQVGLETRYIPVFKAAAIVGGAAF
jgi:hypothetical protein